MVKFDLARQADSGSGRKPAIPLNKREAFVNDVRGTNGVTKMERADLRKKYGKHFNNDRVMDEWIKWARGLEGQEVTDA